jgi:hypothetical protein
MTQDAIDVTLRAEPLQLAVAERKNFKISIAATNGGGATVDPELHRKSGKPSANGRFLAQLTPSAEDRFLRLSARSCGQFEGQQRVRAWSLRN